MAFVVGSKGRTLRFKLESSSKPAACGLGGRESEDVGILG